MKGSVLVYGIGNPGRQDDALGTSLVDMIDQWITEKDYRHIHTDQNYQLNIEDADLIGNYDLVIFVDASVLEITSTLMEEVQPDLRTDFSMHSVEPAFVVGLCRQMFKKTPKCYQLHIKAYEFGFMKPMTQQARQNLELAFQQLCNFILSFPLALDH